MELKLYKGKQVKVDRIYSVGNRMLVDLQEVATGKKHKGVDAGFEKGGQPPKLEPKTKKPSVNSVIKFTKGNKTVELVKDTDEYVNYIHEHNLNVKFVDNCIKGISKTHKGYTIKLK